MDLRDLEIKWDSLKPQSQGSFNSLRISGDCIPDLYVGLDVNNIRCLILQLPEKHAINFASVIKQNLSLELFNDTNWIILKLSNSQYKDLFNDLIISLYNKIKTVSEVTEYTRILIDAFYRWNEFFEDNVNIMLSEEALIGLVGEMLYLTWEIEHGAPNSINEILSAWKGPFDRGNDFIFSNRNVEVKTKQTDALDVMISSEFQLQPEIGKELKLVIINILKDAEGVSLSDITNRVRSLVVQRFGDFSILLKAIHQKGVTTANIGNYDHLRLRLVSMVGYNCMHERFPKINLDTKPRMVNTVKYNIRISELNEFITDRYN